MQYYNNLIIFNYSHPVDSINQFLLTLIVLGGLFGPCDAKLSEKNTYTAFIKQISLFDTALFMTKT